MTITTPLPGASLPSPSEAAPRILSGITPSGSLTLGNYLGALRRFVESQNSVDSQNSLESQNSVDSRNSAGDRQGFFFVADLHAMTTPHDPRALQDLATETAALFFAAGLEPARSTVFMQSHVPAHVELSYLLECTAYVGELGRMIQFKEKGGRPKTRASLFTYPCLMAADILLYDTHVVPVGGDQDQHVELCRDLAVRFNRSYGETFVVPRLARAALASRVADLVEPTTKMSKSAPLNAPGVIRMLDTPDAVRRKIARAVTDSDGEVRYDPETKPGVSNLLDIIAVISGERPSDVATGFTTYGELKAACIQQVVDVLDPIRRRHDELVADPAELGRMLRIGAERAREQAAPVLARARAAVGLSSPA